MISRRVIRASEDHSFWILFSLLLVLIRGSAAAETTIQDLAVSSSCESHCGGIAIPFPFGIGKGCYLSEWYEIICSRSTSGKLVPLLVGINKEVVNISLPSSFDITYSNNVSYGSVRIKSPISSWGCSSNDEETGLSLNMTSSPFFISTRNSLVVVGCDNKASLMNGELIINQCVSTCDGRDFKGGESERCSGHKCCQAKLPDEFLQRVGVRIDTNNSRGGGCRVAFLTYETYSSTDISEPQVFRDNGYTTVELQWFIDARDRLVGSLGCMRWRRRTNCVCSYPPVSPITYASCNCNHGYRGNPYLLGGCKDIDECVEGSHRCGEQTCVNTPGDYECAVNKTLAIIIGVGSGFGLLLLVGGMYRLYKLIKRKKRMNRSRKFFKRNGGLLLQQQLTSTEGKVEKTRIFSSEELEKATENFSLSRVLGQGGQGTVYKGMSADGRIVAVKMSKLVDEDKLEEFINEVVILSQINHRNIVKLLGCCLETEVPLLVYEFVPNGNLFEHLHGGFDDNTMNWQERLRIATEIAGALSYLHSAASCPIYHRDIKSTNILLDEKYRAKVSDFGTSRSVAIDQTHLTTLVAGTFGYFDPEYFRSSQYTDKSDVYSFGVVLVELITGEKPVSHVRSEENRGLAAHFIDAMKENRLFEMVDYRIKEDSNLEQIMSVATLARRCLNMKGKKRPSMREVSLELERIQSAPGDSLQVQIEDDEEYEVAKFDTADAWNIVVSASASEIAAASSPSSDAEPLFPHQTR